MKDETKTLIADELFYTSKCFIIGFMCALVLCILVGELNHFFDDYILLNFVLLSMGIGYSYRLVKWVVKWKSK